MNDYIDHISSEPSEAYIALGANLGDREGSLMEALHRLDGHPRIQVLKVSSLYETDPVGYVDQPNFLNMTALLRTELEPLELLKVMLETELALGRKRTIRWGPRTVDLDLLWMDGILLNTPELTLPHPRMMERAFVLVPLSELDLEGHAPVLKPQVDTALKQLPEKEGIRLWKTCSWQSASAPFES